MSDPNLPPTASPVPAALPTKKSPWLFVGLGCLVVVILGFVAASVAVSWGAKKIAKMSQDVKSNPEKFAAELIIKANPRLELVTSDPKTGEMTIREKETGKETTFSYKDIASGKFSMKENGKIISIDASQTAKTGSVVFQDGDKTTTLGSGSGADKLPDWIPIYPGWTISSDGGFHMKTEDESAGSVAGTTRDAVTKVSSYYKHTLEKAGFVCEEMSAKVGEVEMSSVSAKNKALGQEITVSIQKEEARPEAQVTLIYESKKK